MSIGFPDYRSGYDGADYYHAQERRYREEMDRQRMMAMHQQQMAYIPPQPLAAVQKAQADDRFTSNKKLLLLEN